MEWLRWILLALGVALVLGIYVFAMLKKARNREPLPSYEEVDWEQDSVQSLSEPEEDEFDDLPSMDALQAARVQSAVEGVSYRQSLPAVETEAEVPVLEEVVATPDSQVASVETSESVVEVEESAVNPQLRELWLKGHESQDPIMGTPISAVELEDVQASHTMSADGLHGDLDSTYDQTANADGLKTAASHRQEPSLSNHITLDIDGEAVAAALQRRREQAVDSSEVVAPVSKPVQNTFSFDDEQKAQLKKAPSEESKEQRAQRIKATANKKLREEAEARVQKKADALRQQHQQELEAKRLREQNQREEVVALHVKAKDSIGFYGPEMVQCFSDIGIKFGDMGIYHYQSSGQRLLSVANMVKPGTFDPDNMTGFTTVGISLFLQLNPDSDFELCEQVLVKSAQYIAYKLKGDVLTEDHGSFDNVQQAALSRRLVEIQASFKAT